MGSYSALACRSAAVVLQAAYGVPAKGKSNCGSPSLPLLFREQYLSGGWKKAGGR